MQRITALLLALLPQLPAQDSSPPNVVLIVTDDQGIGDFGHRGNSAVNTPNLDAMAAQSAQLTSFYVSPVCAPTRACLMTGRYNYRTRVVDTYIGRAMMEPQEVTIAEVLRDAGYATGIFGKWHLGDCYPMRPMDQGFQESLVHRGGGIGQPSDPLGAEGDYTDAPLLYNGKLEPTTGYCTDVYFEAAMSWMLRARDAGRPSFTYIATNAPHGPFHDVPDDVYQSYLKDLDALGNDRSPQETGHPLPEKANLDRRARIFAMITNIDSAIGRLLAMLDREGMRQNTLVLFMVDNGPNGRRFVGGMRGMKSEVYEGGIRSPLLAHWPGRLEAGHDDDRVTAHIDLMPTILEACGVAPPEDLTLDGRSAWPLLTGAATDWDDRTLYIQAHRGNQPVRYHNFAARNQRWKLVHATGFGSETMKDRPFELYDMQADPLELSDVAAEHPEVVERMKREYDAWFDDVGSTRDDNYAVPRIVLGSDAEPTTTLTRQDWRRESADSGWAAGSRGAWLTEVATAGDYDLRIHWHGKHRPESMVLEIGGQTLEQDVPDGVDSVTFESVGLTAGPLELRATLLAGDTKRGPYQVLVTRR